MSNLQSCVNLIGPLCHGTGQQNLYTLSRDRMDTYNDAIKGVPFPLIINLMLQQNIQNKNSLLVKIRYRPRTRVALASEARISVSSSTGLPFSTLTIALHLKDRRQSNKQTNKTRTIPMDLNNPVGDQYTQNHP